MSMPSQTPTLAEFLLARIAEDEAVAREALDRPGGDIRADSVVYDDGVRNPAIAVSPPRLLAECEAKRRIVDWFSGSDPDDQPAVWLLALPYADHPDYRQEWKP